MDWEEAPGNKVTQKQQPSHINDNGLGASQAKQLLSFV